MTTWLNASPLARVDRHRIAQVIYVTLASVAAAALVLHGQPWAAVVPALALVGVWGIVASGALLRLGYVGTGFSDQVLVSEAARARFLAGASPYGVGYEASVPPGAPFPYGPLALLDSVPLELAASIALLILLALARRPITLALYAGFPFAISLASAGNNDFVPTLLLAAGLLALPRAWGAILIGLSAAWKPYTVVFLPVAIANGSITTFIAGALTVAVGWLPAWLWGGYPESLALLNAMQGSSPWRFVAAPIAVSALRFGALAACTAFAVLTMTSEIWSLAYFVPLGVALGVTLELPDARQ